MDSLITAPRGACTRCTVRNRSGPHGRARYFDEQVLSERASEPVPLADSVDQAYTPTLKLLNLPQFKPTTTFRRRKERLPFVGDQRIDNEPEFIDQPGIDKARRSLSTPHEIDVLAGLLLKGCNFFESPDETRAWPESRSQVAR
jgi:hypothetical protein